MASDSDVIDIQELSPALASKVRRVYNYIHERQQYQLDLVNNNSDYYERALQQAYRRKYDLLLQPKIDTNSTRYREFAENFVYVPETEFIYPIGDRFVTAQDGQLIHTDYVKTFTQSGNALPHQQIIGPIGDDKTIWMVCDQEIFVDREDQIPEALRKAVPKCTHYLYALNADRAAYNDEQITAGETKWQYPSKVNNRQIIIHMIAAGKRHGQAYYGMWREEEGEFYIRLLHLVNGREEGLEFKKLFKGMVAKEIRQFIRNETNPTIKKLLELVQPNQEFVQAVYDGQLPFKFSESFENFIGQVDQNRSKELDWDEVIEEAGPNVVAIQVE